MEATLREMKSLRDKQAARLAKAMTDNEPKSVIARNQKLLDDINASLKVFTDLKMFMKMGNAQRV